VPKHATSLTIWSEDVRPWSFLCTISYIFTAF
jgi:hypothetical protein